MKVILLDNIKKLGKQYETIDVKNGYAHNFLIPRKMAVMATADALQGVAQLQKQYESTRADRMQAMKSLFGRLEGTTTTVVVKANEQRVLYDSLNAETVAGYLSATAGDEVDASLVDMNTPIKTIGSHDIALSYDDEKITCVLDVQSEE
jgi:large subunit ribosomal protein L9